MNDYSAQQGATPGRFSATLSRYTAKAVEDI